MRTDSTRVSRRRHRGGARATSASATGADYLPAEPNVYKSKKGAQDAHEAIRPTALDVHARGGRALPREGRVDALQADLEPLRRLPDEAGASTTRPRSTSSAGRARSLPRHRPGHEVRRLHPRLHAKAATTSRHRGRGARTSASSRRSTRATRSRCTELDPEQHFTQPPPRFTEATLIKELEEKGIGRPSTYARSSARSRTASTSRRREAALLPDRARLVVTDLLVESFPDILNVEFTAGMEDRARRDRGGPGRTGWR